MNSVERFGRPTAGSGVFKKLDGLILNTRTALQGDIGGNRKSRSKETPSSFRISEVCDR